MGNSRCNSCLENLILLQMLNMENISFYCDGISGSGGDSGVVSVSDKDKREFFLS